MSFSRILGTVFDSANLRIRCSIANVWEKLIMELKSTRRIVTGHDAQGKAVVLIDAKLEAKQRGPGPNGWTLLWTTREFPADVSGSTDRAQGHVGVPPVANGTVFRIVDFAPAPPHAAPVDHNQILISMGIDP